MSPARWATKVLTMLADERAMLRAGRFDGLDEIARKKARYIDDLAQMSLPADMLQRLNRELVQNAALLQAALEGVQTARQIIIAAGEGKSVRVYGRDGMQSLGAGPGAALERKA